MDAPTEQPADVDDDMTAEEWDALTADDTADERICIFNWRKE